MSTTSTRQVLLRSLITGFLNERMNSKLEKLKPEDPNYAELFQQLSLQYNQQSWLEDAALRVLKVQAATHSLKPIHPDARGTCVYSLPDSLPALFVMGSRCLHESAPVDFVCNASLLPIVAFLSLEFEGHKLMALAAAKDVDLAKALTDDPVQAESWMASFATPNEARGQPSSDRMAKQTYWLVGEDPFDTASYHLLAPLFPSSLVHSVYQKVQFDQFGDDAKAARKAKKAGVFSDLPVHYYLQMVVQQLGGTKPYNIGSLNNARGGSNYLLASIPPTRRAEGLQPLLRTDSMFASFENRPEPRRTIKGLRDFLKTDPKRNRATRETRTQWIRALIDEFLQFRAEYRALESGWSQRPDCYLDEATKFWLDPDGVRQACALSGQAPPKNTDETISATFADWINKKLRNPLEMGDDEFRQWRTEIQDQIKAEQRESRYAS